MGASLSWIYEWGNAVTFNRGGPCVPIVYGDAVIMNRDHQRRRGRAPRKIHAGANEFLIRLAFLVAGPLLC
jgi:hypothetical protein